MKCKMYLPYFDALKACNDNKTSEMDDDEFIKKLEEVKTESKIYASTIQNFFASENASLINNNVRKETFFEQKPNSYAICNISLLNENGNEETVESFMNKFLPQKPCFFWVRVQTDKEYAYSDFLDELRAWNNDTGALIKLAKKQGKKAEEWLDEAIPKKTINLMFKNNSNKSIQFRLEDCEVEEKMGKYDYMLYVNNISVFKC